MKLNKKAVSPLIATVLLIAFAVALGAVVMNWGRSYVETTAEYAERGSDIQILCSRDINLKTDDVCYDTDDDTIEFTLENAGTIDIDGLMVTVRGNESINTTELENATLKIAFVKKFNITYDINNDGIEGFGEIEEVKIVPMITTKATKEPVPCANSPIRETEVIECK